MKIYYTNKLIWWSNEGNDFFEKNKFDEYLNDWIELPNTKSVNWVGHYEVNFYASNNFEATYFKIVKNNVPYYFFINDIVFDGVNGRQFFLKLDLYNTYTTRFIETLKQENPFVNFKRRHADRFDEKGKCDILNKQSYILNIPDYLKQYESFKVPYIKDKIVFKNDGTNDLGTYNFKNLGDLGDLQLDIANFVWCGNNENTCGYYFAYLKIKRPPSGVNFSEFYKRLEIAECYYVPIKTPKTASSGTNTWTNIQDLPSDYVIGVVLSPINPTYFKYAVKIKDLFAGFTNSQKGKYPFFENNESICFPASYHDYNVEVLISDNIIKDADKIYNVYNYEYEPALYNKEFYEYKVNDEFSSSPICYLDKLLITSTNAKIINDAKINFNILFGIDLLGRFDATSDYVNNTFLPKQYISLSYALPFSGDTYNSYLLNNVNSINTGIALAGEQKDMDRKWAITNATLGAVSATAKASAKWWNPGSWISGAASAAQSISTGVEEVERAEFSYKKTVSNVNASLADVSAKPDKMLDSYGIGVSVFNSNIFSLTHYRLSEIYLKTIFMDYYLNGYITNSYEQFNNYNNRKLFNYFELTNAYALISRYVKFPKKILNECAKQVENGIRLWKNEFNISGTLDNLENKYA